MITGFNGKYRFLSNFFESPINFEGTEYKTVEHAYQAAKTTDTDLRAMIANADSATIAKRLGRNLVLRPDWEDVKLTIMLTLLRKKFRDHKHLQATLLATNQEQLYEYNYWHDTFWGTCTCVKHQLTPGANWLGKLLMQVREEIRSSGTDTTVNFIEHESIKI